MLTTYELLMGSTDMNGENLMTAFLMAALLLGVRRRYLLSGVLAGLALGSGLYALAAVLALLAAAALTSRRAGARFGLGVLAGFVGVSLPFIVIGGAGFFKGVFAYHFAKPTRGSDHVPVFGSPNPFAMLGALVHDVPAYLASKGFKKTLYFQAPEYLAAALAAALLLGKAAWARWRPDRQDEERWQDFLTPRDLLSSDAPGFVKLGLLSTLLFLIQWSALPEVYAFYMVPMFALMALPAAWVLHEAYVGVRDARAWEELAVPSVLGLPAPGPVARRGTEDGPDRALRLAQAAGFGVARCARARSVFRRPPRARQGHALLPALRLEQVAGVLDGR
jgi:hypothetical protein